MEKRNNLVEFARFMFSLLVIGYHVQMSFSGDEINFFENGALAVEFFFLISGYFLARSIEKINSKENSNFVLDSCCFMANKVKGILPTHLTAITAIIIVILVCDMSNAGTLIVQGLPSLFLVQEFIVWNNAYANALIVPEWYISSMLICMAIMVPIAILLRKKIKGVFVVLVLLGVLGVLAIIVGLCMNWTFTTTFVYDLRGWGEMCIGMFAYYLSNMLSKKQYKSALTNILKIVEIVGYSIPMILGFIPMNATLQPVFMGVAVVGVFVAISITFAGKGIAISNSKLNAVLGYLGSLSLAMYLFHPVIISLLDYTYIGIEDWAKYLIVFVATLVLAAFFNLIVGLIRKFIAKIKSDKKQLNEIS